MENLTPQFFHNIHKPNEKRSETDYKKSGGGLKPNWRRGSAVPDEK